jgi:coenzyme F420-reducing hydrogenase delta subunit
MKINRIGDEEKAQKQSTRLRDNGKCEQNWRLVVLSRIAQGRLVNLGDCHYQTSSQKASARAEAITLMLGDFALETERFRLECVSAWEA